MEAIYAGMLTGALVAAVFTFAGLTPLGIFSGVWGLIINLFIYTAGSFAFSTAPSKDAVSSMDGQKATQAVR
ncbi:hypothetical protein [Salinicoccus roseus]|uniref:hypothetical protein n=1 Tax=Salinicoccus roseus TaxID=45670 RepID=UPI001EF73015|nr:hypothetical protein [Salinicoccus roseus]MCG7331900.1 hypothetical protein [Salinicoccus roseus]